MSSSDDMSGLAGVGLAGVGRAGVGYNIEDDVVPKVVGTGAEDASIVAMPTTSTTTATTTTTTSPITEKTTPACSTQMTDTDQTSTPTHNKKCQNSETEKKATTDTRAANLVIERHWQSMYKRLIDYKAKYGNCLVPLKDKTHKQLGQWVKNQRAHQVKDTISSEHFHLLKDIGFYWAPTKKNQLLVRQNEETEKAKQKQHQWQTSDGTAITAATTQQPKLSGFRNNEDELKTNRSCEVPVNLDTDVNQAAIDTDTSSEGYANDDAIINTENNKNEDNGAATTNTFNKSQETNTTTTSDANIILPEMVVSDYPDYGDNTTYV